MGNSLCCGCVSSSEIGVLERFGKYNSVIEPGLYFKFPIIDELSHVMSMKKLQTFVIIDTKTLDNVFCKVKVAVVYSVKQNEIYNAVYGYSDFRTLIDSYVQNEIRSELSRITLDESFLQKITMSNNVKQYLKENISFGYNIHEVLINDIEPDPKVRAAMNEINTQQRIKLAVQEKAEGYKIEVLSKATSDARASEINGEGIAKTKLAIISGYKRAFPELTNSQISELMMTSEQIEVMNSISNKSKSSTIFLPYGKKMNLNMNMPSNE